MKKVFSAIFISTLLFFCSFSLLLAEGKPATELNKVVKTEGLSGLNLFLAETYNNDRILFAVISTGSIVVLGLLVTYIIGFFVKPTGHSEKAE